MPGTLLTVPDSGDSNCELRFKFILLKVCMLSTRQTLLFILFTNSSVIHVKGTLGLLKFCVQYDKVLLSLCP